MDEPRESGSARLGYVPSFDGCRGLAVLAVMGFHASKNHFPGGMLGVDAFFVLSGFLITTLLLEEREISGRISLRAFWQRRILRLVPGFALMLLATAGYALLLAPTEIASLILREIPPAALYLSNTSLAETLFATEPAFLYHTWSLSQEEQFYILWPPVLIVALRLVSPRVLFSMLAAAAAVGFVVRWIPMVGTPLDDRPDALLVGCAAAVARWRWLRASRRQGSLQGKRGQVASSLTLPLVVLLALMVFVPASTLLEDPERLLYPVTSVAMGVFIIALVGDTHSLAGRILASAPLVFVGKLSYCLYLWHLPVYKAVAISVTRATIPNIALKLLISFLLAWGTYVLIEKPIQSWRRRPRRPADGKC